jgi:ABC-type antimicrobial peptide transport system permease subunit
MKSDSYWQNFSSGHKIFLSILTLTLIAGLFSLCILVFIIYTIIQVTKSREAKQRISGISQDKSSAGVRRTRFLFDNPVLSDWLFWVFTVTLASSILSGVPNVLNSSNRLISGVFGILLLVIFAWFPIIPVIYLIRKSVRKRKK